MSPLMTTAQSSSSSIPKKLWIAVRFVLFGIGGFWLLVFSFISFAERMVEHNRSFINPFVSLPLAFAGAVMMVYGSGEWGRWAYLWVFLSIPAGLGLLILFPDAGKELGVFLVAAPLLGSYAIVRRYYRRRDTNRTQALHDPAALLNSRPQEPK
jgi:hypothetical protein